MKKGILTIFLAVALGVLAGGTARITAVRGVAEETSPTFITGESGKAFSLENVEEAGKRQGVALFGEGENGIIFDALWSEELSGAQIKMRLDLAETGLWQESGALGYTEISVRSDTMTLAVRVEPCAADSFHLKLFVADGETVDESKVTAEQNYLPLARADDGAASIFSLSAWETPDLLVLDKMQWNIAFNSQAYSNLKDYEGKRPPSTSSERRAFVAGELKRFLDSTASGVKMSVRVVNTGDTLLKSKITVEQVGERELYDVVKTDGMYVNPDDVGYQKYVLRWNKPEDTSLCGGIRLTRYEKGIITKEISFATVERYTYEDDGLSQKKRYVYRLELVDDIMQPVPKVYYRYNDFEIQPKQGQPVVAIGAICAVVAVCVGYVVIYTFLPLKKGRKKLKK